MIGLPGAADGGVTATSSERLPGDPGSRASVAVDGDLHTAYQTPVNAPLECRGAAPCRRQVGGVLGLPVRHPGRRHRLHQPPHQALGRHPVGHRVEGEHQPVGEDVHRQLPDVLGQHVLPAAQQRLRPGGRDQAEGGPGLAPYASSGAISGSPNRPGSRVARMSRTTYSASAWWTKTRRRGLEGRSRCGVEGPDAGSAGRCSSGRGWPARRRRWGSRPPPSSGSGRAAPRGAGRRPPTRSGSGWPAPGTARVRASCGRRWRPAVPPSPPATPTGPSPVPG